jgi:hypothetical protein
MPSSTPTREMLAASVAPETAAPALVTAPTMVAVAAAEVAAVAAEAVAAAAAVGALHLVAVADAAAEHAARRPPRFPGPATQVVRPVPARACSPA